MRRQIGGCTESQTDTQTRQDYKLSPKTTNSPRHTVELLEAGNSSAGGEWGALALALPFPALPCPALSCDRIFNFASDCLSRHILGLAFGSTQTRITDVVNFAIRPLVSLGNAGWTLRLYLHTGSMSPASSCLAPSCTA